MNDLVKITEWYQNTNLETKEEIHNVVLLGLDNSKVIFELNEKTRLQYELDCCWEEWIGFSDEQKIEFFEIYQNKKLVFLAKLGIVFSTNEMGESDIQRIDNPQEFKEENELSFTPPLLKNDDEAKAIFNSLTHSQLERI